MKSEGCMTANTCQVLQQQSQVMHGKCGVLFTIPSCKKSFLSSSSVGLGVCSHKWPIKQWFQSDLLTCDDFSFLVGVLLITIDCKKADKQRISARFRFNSHYISYFTMHFSLLTFAVCHLNLVYILL